MDALVSFSFPPSSDDSVNAQFQAISGLHGVSMHEALRVPLLHEGGLEPLTIAAGGKTRFTCVDIQREAAATLSNLSLAEPNRILIAKSGAMPALVDLVRKSDSTCQVHAVIALANLAESSGEIHQLILDELCLDRMCQLVQEKSTPIDVKRAISRFMSLLTSNSETHPHILESSLVNSIQVLIGFTNDAYCERFGALAIANLALNMGNHSILLRAQTVESLLSLIQSVDVETLRGISVALHSLARFKEYHSFLESSRTVVGLVTLARCGDRDTALQACLAIKHLCVCEICRNMFVEAQVLEALSSMAACDDVEIRREMAATLRNISLSDQNKESIMEEDGMIDLLAKLARDPDDNVAFQACGTIANIAERSTNKIGMMDHGIIHHLQFSMLSKTNSVLQESIRAIANLSSARENIPSIVSSGALGHLIAALDSSDRLSRYFAAMTMSNLASSDETRARIVREHGVPSLMAILRQSDTQEIDVQSQQHAMACLANLATSHDIHCDLIINGCVEESVACIKSSNDDIRSNAILCISNLASNKETHSALEKMTDLVPEIIQNLQYSNMLTRLRAVTALHGLSTNLSCREKIICCGGAESLLPFIHSNDKDLTVEVLSTLCNLSLGGYMGARVTTLLQKIDLPNLLSFLCDSDSTHRLFGAMAIGNIASHLDLQAPIFDCGALQPLIGLSGDNLVDMESQRCIAYAICNLSTEVQNRMPIIVRGGLLPIMSLCHTGDAIDMLTSLSTLRGLAVSVEARRPILEEGVLSVLSLVMKSDCLKCKRMVSDVLVLLSLNEENMVDIARSDEIKDFMLLLDSDDSQCMSQICRCMGNMSEDKALHTDILQVVNVERLEHLLSCCDPMVILELSRLFANLTSNFNIHSVILTPHVLHKIGVLCLHEDVDIRRFSQLAFANLCLNVNSHKELDVEEIVSVLCNAIVIGDVAKYPDRKDEAAFHAFVEGKVYACLAISALCQNSSIARRMTDVGIIPPLVKLLQLNSADINLHVAFVFSKLSRFSFTHQELGHQTLILTKHIQATNECAVTYSVSALRRLCANRIVRVDLNPNNVVNFMSTLCDNKNIARCREIASSICHFTLWDEARVHIIQSNLIGHVIELAQSPDGETSRFALGALANIAEDDRFHDLVVATAGIVHILVTLTKSPILSIVREASRALANLFSSTVAQNTFLKEKEFDSLVNVGKLQDYECAYNAAAAFRKLAANSFSHEYFFAHDYVNAVFDLSSREERNLQLQGASALRDLSSNQFFKCAFADLGGIRAAIELSSLPDIDLQIIAFSIVRHLSIPMQLKRKLLDSGIVSIMADCVARTDNEGLLYQCASSIANIAEHAHNKLALVQMGGIRCLVALSSKQSAPVRRETARAFSLLSCAPENDASVFDEIVLPHVVSLLCCEEEETGRDSAAAISNVVSSPEIKKLIGDLGGIPLLASLLASPFESCQLSSCRALCRLTTHEENKVSLYCAGGLKSLIHLSTSLNIDISLMSIMVLCNISTCSGFEIQYIEGRYITTLGQLLISNSPVIRKNAMMTVCNLTCQNLLRDHISTQINLSCLLDLMSDITLDVATFATMTLCNLAAKTDHGSAILDAEGLRPLLRALNGTDGVSLQRVALLAMYNLSACETSQPHFLKSNATQSIIAFISNSSDRLCRRLALKILANVACNEKTRAESIKGGGLQAVILALKDIDETCRRLACLCLANMANDPFTQSQIVIHGGLPALVTLCLVDDDVTQDCSFMCLGNIAANVSTHLPFLKQGVYKAFARPSSTNAKRGRSPCIAFGIANLTSNSDNLSEIGRGGGVMSLIALAKSSNVHYKCLALSSIRRLAIIRENRDLLVADGVVETLMGACKTDLPEIQREVASCFCNLSLAPNLRLGIARLAMSELVFLTESVDLDTVRLSLKVLGNLSEDIDAHAFISPVLESIVVCLEKDELDIKREAARAVSNMLSSDEVHPQIIRRGLDSLIRLSANACEQCRYFTSLSFHKLSQTRSSHYSLVNDGLQHVIALARDQDINIRKHASTALRDLCASGIAIPLFFELGGPAYMVELVKENDRDVQVIAVAVLRHVATCDTIADNFSGSDIMQCVIRCIYLANEDLRCQIAGLFANLSEHKDCQSAMVVHEIVPSIDSLLSAGEHDEIWKVRSLGFRTGSLRK